MNERAAPYVLAAGQARSHPGSFPVIKAGAADTGGLLTVADGMLGPRTTGPPLHVHYETDESFYVVEGHLLIQVGEERHDLVSAYSLTCRGRYGQTCRGVERPDEHPASHGQRARRAFTPATFKTEKRG
jgi:hypothetical protein